MYAIVDIAGQQFKVEKERKIFVHRLDANEGDTVEFEKVLLLDNDSNVTIEAPSIVGAKVTAKIIGHVKGDKEKKKPGYVQHLVRADSSPVPTARRTLPW